jgi:hypothetical protein
MDTSAQQLGVFGPTEILCSYDTYQFSNYERYDAATFSEAHKAEVRDNQFPIDLEKAYELGKRLVKDASYLLKKRIFIIIFQKIVVPLCRTSKGHT